MTSVSAFHLTLPLELHEMLRKEAECSGQPESAVAREALESGLSLRKQQRLHQEIASWAAEHAGTELDLDRDLEQAGLEILTREPSR